MSASVLLAKCAAAGIAIVRDGDDLRVRATNDSALATLAPRIRELKPALHEILLQEEIIALACLPTDTFDRSRFDALYAEWEQRYRLPREAEGEQPCPE